MTMRALSIKRLSFIIACLYVGIGTIYALTYWTYASIGLGETIGKILFVFFLPTSFVAIAILFAERNPAGFLILSQTVILFVIWGIIYFIVNLFRDEAT